MIFKIFTPRLREYSVNSSADMVLSFARGTGVAHNLFHVAFWCFYANYYIYRVVEVLLGVQDLFHLGSITRLIPRFLVNLCTLSFTDAFA